MAQQRFEGSASINHRTHRQHGIKPVAELPRKTLEDQIRGKPFLPVRFVGRKADGAERNDPRIQPGIAHILYALRQTAALFASNLHRIDIRPVRRIPLEHFPAFNRFFFQLFFTADDNKVVALAANPDREGESPKAFLGDHPIAHVAKPVLLARFAFRWNPLDGRNDVLNAIAPIHANEPLVDRAEHKLFLAAPAVRINVGIFLASHEHAARLQCSDNIVRHFVGIAFGKLSEAIEKNRAVIQRCDERDAVFLAKLLVFRAATRRDMDKPGTFGFADLFPTNHAMGFRGALAAARFAVRENAARCFLGRKLVKRSLIGQANQIFAWKFFDDFDPTASLQNRPDGRQLVCLVLPFHLQILHAIVLEIPFRHVIKPVAMLDL